MHATTRPEGRQGGFMSSRPCIFGEVLFDHFPDGRRVLGGAPFNVAWHLQAFGAAPYFISRTGADADGESISGGMREWGMDMGGLQTDRELPTGRVQVSFTAGEPAYDIVHPAAWDAIEAPVGHPPIALLYHGSLALRERVSRQACQRLRGAAPSVVFIDVNLRPPWWRRESVLEDIDGADWVKLNHDELDQLAPGGATARSKARDLLDEFSLDGILLTDGSRGAEVLTGRGEHFATTPATDIIVKDTVGAGDAMASVMLLGILRQWPLGQCLERAQEFASAIVGQRGATVPDNGFYRKFLDAWSETI